jgi:hypothetical protein
VEQKINPIYSNIVNVRISETELILDFGCIIPEAGETLVPPISFEPTVRVILAVKGTRPLADMLMQASHAQEIVKTQPAELGHEVADAISKTASQA